MIIKELRDITKVIETDILVISQNTYYLNKINIRDALSELEITKSTFYKYNNIYILHLQKKTNYDIIFTRGDIYGKTNKGRKKST